MLVKFSCDCIGYRFQDPVNGEVRCWAIEPCDDNGTDPNPNIWERESLIEKTFEPLRAQEVERLMKRLSSFVDKGHRFSVVRNALQEVDGDRP